MIKQSFNRKAALGLPGTKVVLLIILVLVILLVPANVNLFKLVGLGNDKIDEKRCEEFGDFMPICGGSGGALNCYADDTYCNDEQYEEFQVYLNELRNECYEENIKESCDELERIEKDSGAAVSVQNADDFYQFLIENKDKFSSRLKTTIERMPKEHIELVYTESKSKGIDHFISFAVIVQESVGDPNAVSSAGAVGYMQLMPATAEEVGVPASQRSDPILNIQGGTAYLKLVQRYVDSTEPRLYLAAYNGGAGNIKDNPESSWPAESQDYYKKVLGYHSEMVGLASSFFDDSSYSGDPIDYLANVNMVITSCYYRTSTGKYHGATDYQLLKDGSLNNVLIHSLTDGEVYYVGLGTEGGYGNNVRVRNNGKYYIYAHLDSVKVKVGDKVTVGSEIGIQGGTGGNYPKHGHFGTTSVESSPGVGEFAGSKRAGEFNADHVIRTYKSLGIKSITFLDDCIDDNKVSQLDNLIKIT